MEEKGLIYVFTGNGKGKTTAAVGQAVRFAGQGFKVLMVQFIKQIVSGEVAPLKKLGVEIYPMGLGYVGILSDQKEKETHVHEEEFDLLVLDEVNNSVHLGLLEVGEVVDFLKNRPQELSVILTGRDAPAQFKEMADLVSEVKDVKHPYEKGISAKKGSEF
ncbi:MAG: Cob(I)alamin adenosyltransferase [candidate division CPR1 bacterium GW2011_GWC1_49_13]|uniref:Cob(I)alamin adenosyltransferase n=1 Tax=candidate division CPR1 bacterium GW2011_GWC1_49_13 TaxID=1618342 RepID=A0A0G1VHG0_9BACT|nr:MAG: Cob(I)alamin adenosyltransferase [candidate division CPR1 bacterium GW2011_GWC1_49_13]